MRARQLLVGSWLMLAPAAAASSNSSAPGVGQRCGGGNKYNGTTSCPSGLFCNATNEFWWDCQKLPHGIGQRCGGAGYKGDTTCPDGLVCLMKDQFWSDCQLKPRRANVATINTRFVGGHPCNDLSQAGVLIHQFHNGVDGDWKPWMPCPATCNGGPCWCASFGDRFSASLLNSKLVTKKGKIGMYSLQNAGFIFAPGYMKVSCAYPADGGSEGKNCKPGEAGCLPGCGSKWCKFNPAMPNNMDTSCAWPVTELQRVMTLQQGANSVYNEVVVDAKALVDNLPASIEAIFYVKGSPAAAEAQKVHADFLATFGAAAAGTLLLEMDTKSPQAPFKAVGGGAAPPPAPVVQAYDARAAAPAAGPVSRAAAAGAAVAAAAALLAAAVGVARRTKATVPSGQHMSAEQQLTVVDPDRLLAELGPICEEGEELADGI